VTDIGCGWTGCAKSRILARAGVHKAYVVIRLKASTAWVQLQKFRALGFRLHPNLLLGCGWGYAGSRGFHPGGIAQGCTIGCWGLPGVAAWIHLSHPTPYACSCWGLPGVAAWIHFHWSCCRWCAVGVCRESPLGYTHKCVADRRGSVGVCRESPLGYTHAFVAHSEYHVGVCRESPLGYTNPSGTSSRTAVGVCRESPLGYTERFGMLRIPVVGVCRESPLGYTKIHCTYSLWWVGVCRESPLGYTRLPASH
jgi:hypothetical protein